MKTKYTTLFFLSILIFRCTPPPSTSPSPITIFEGDTIIESAYNEEVELLKRQITELSTFVSKENEVLKDELLSLNTRINFLEEFVQKAIAESTEKVPLDKGEFGYPLTKAQKETTNIIINDTKKITHDLKKYIKGGKKVNTDKEKVINAEIAWEKIDATWKKIIASDYLSFKEENDPPHQILTPRQKAEIRFDYTKFNYTKGDIKNLKGFEFYKKLTEININNNQKVTSAHLKSLKHLNNLQVLDISYTGVDDLSELASIISLKKLNCSNNKLISDLTPIKNLVNLKVLECQDNIITKVSHLRKLRKLTEIEVSSNELVDLDGVQYLLQLESIHLEGNNSLTQLSMLYQLISNPKASLTYISVSRNHYAPLTKEIEKSKRKIELVAR